MIRLARDFRLIPVVLFAAICLFTLKVIGLVRDGGYTLAGSTGGASAPADASSTRTAQNLPLSLSPKQSWAQEMFNFPDVTGSVSESRAVQKPAASASRYADITGSVSEAKSGEKPAASATKKPGPADPPPKPDGTPVTIDPSRPASPAERAILERLQERRQEIEARARELEIRDGLLKAAEKRLEARVAELKELEAKVSTAMQNKEDADAARFKGLVAMYENMKAKDAAKIFDRLDLTILVQVTSHINPRRMGDILGQMSPEAAERLTVELANRASATERIPTAAELPKIEGKPSGG